MYCDNTAVCHIPYSGLFSKQKFLQERRNLNFKELRLQISKNSVTELVATIIYNYAYGFINNYVCLNYASSL